MGRSHCLLEKYDVGLVSEIVWFHRNGRWNVPTLSPMSRYFPDCITDIKVVYVEDHPTDLFFEVINKPGDRKSRMTYSDITVVELTIWLQTLTLVSIIYIYISFISGLSYNFVLYLWLLSPPFSRCSQTLSRMTSCNRPRRRPSHPQSGKSTVWRGKSS